MKMRIETCVAAAMLVLGLISTAHGAGEGEKFEHPALRAPKLTAAPTIDGAMKPGEWDGAAALTGLASIGGVGPYTMVAEVQQVIWHIGYDDQYLYLAMRSPHPKGTYPVTRCKENDSVHQELLFEDHVEVQITPYSRKDATLHGKGFYKIIANAFGTLTDEWHFNGTPGSERLWSMGGPLACTVTEDAWQLEMAVELSRMGIESLDGRSLVIQLVRADASGGYYFAGWAPACWTEWNRFAGVDFSPDAPVLRYTRTGEVMAGELDTLVSLTGGGKPAEVRVQVAVDDAEGKRIYEETKTLALKPGETLEARFEAKGLPISAVSEKSPGRNHFEIKAAMGDTVLFHNRQPFVDLNQGYKTGYLDKWLAGRPQSGEWDARLAYLPYSGKAQAGVNLDFFGMSKEILAATSFSVAIRPARGRWRRAVAEGQAPIKSLGGGLLLDAPKLEDGEYEALFQLLNAKGGAIARKSIAFERRHYPFEHNTLGLNEEVIPPFSRIQANDRSLSVCMGRTYTIGNGGFLDALSAGMPTGQRVASGVSDRLLASPMRLELRVDGQVAGVTNGAVAFTNVAGHRVEVSGTQRLGDLRADVAAEFEYDGWYGVKLTLTPERRMVADALDLVIHLNDIPADTLYVQRGGDGLAGNRMGGIPPETGVFFESTDLPARGKQWLSFVPIAYVGSGDRGLWFFAWSKLGWELREDQSAMTMERLENGQVRMTVRLLAGPVELAGPRTLRFAFQAAPMKPNQGSYRAAADGNYMWHDTCGYRMYGDSVDGWALHTEEDFSALRRWMMYGALYQDVKEVPASWWSSAKGGAHNYRHIVLYGSTFMGGCGAPEHKSFGGEWLGRSNWKPNPDYSYAGWHNVQGTVQWATPEQLSAAWYNWTESMNDFYIWYHKPLMEKCGINGTWFDNASIGQIYEFNPESGGMEETFNLLQRRKLMKRLNHVGWSVMRPPCWLINMHCVDIPFAQVQWQIENDWYSSHIDSTALEVWPLDTYRAMARTKTTMLVAKPSYGGFFGTWHQHPDQALGLKIGRSLVAVQLLHDIVPLRHFAHQRTFIDDLRDKLDPAVGLLDTGRCLFTGYWNAGPFVTPPDPDLKASLYANLAAKSAAVVFANVSRQDLSLKGAALSIDGIMADQRGQVTPRAVKRVYELESGRALKIEPAGEGTSRLVEDLIVPWHEYAIVVVEIE